MQRSKSDLDAATTAARRGATSVNSTAAGTRVSPTKHRKYHTTLQPIKDMDGESDVLVLASPPSSGPTRRFHRRRRRQHHRSNSATVAATAASDSAVRSPSIQRSESTVSAPLNVQHVLHVTWDEKQNAFKGVPDVWKKHLPQAAEYFDSEKLPPHISPAIVQMHQRQSSLCLPRKRRHDRRQRRTTAQYLAERVPTAAASSSSSSSLSPSPSPPSGASSPAADSSRRTWSTQRGRKNNNKRGVKYNSLPSDWRTSQHIHSSRHTDSSLRMNISPRQISVRDYLAAIGFRDLNATFEPDVLRQELLQKLTGLATQCLLTNCPSDIQNMIYTYLDATSLACMARTCSEIARLCNDPILWKPIVRAKNKEQRTLYGECSSGMYNCSWKDTYMTMCYLDHHPTYSDLTWNVVVTGDVRVGKSRLVRSLAESARKAVGLHRRAVGVDNVQNPVAGIFRMGIDIVIRRVVIDSTVIKLQVWDGNAFGANDAPFRSANVVVVVYDVCNQRSFDRVPAIIQQTRRGAADPFHDDNHNTRSSSSEAAASAMAPGPEAVLLFSNDTTEHNEQERAVPYNTAKRFANERGLVYLEANAGDPDSVDSAFARLAEECLHFSFLEQHSDSSDSDDYLVYHSDPRRPSRSRSRSRSRYAATKLNDHRGSRPYQHRSQHATGCITM
jgi:Ras family/P21-Rho-binding domain/F-box-like